VLSIEVSWMPLGALWANTLLRSMKLETVEFGTHAFSKCAILVFAYLNDLHVYLLQIKICSTIDIRLGKWSQKIVSPFF